VGQWKRKAQKMTNEMNDLRMLLEEQNARNNLLEKKQRKFDAECQSLQDAVRQERQAKERYGREKDVLQAEKFTLEQTLAVSGCCNIVSFTLGNMLIIVSSNISRTLVSRYIHFLSELKSVINP